MILVSEPRATTGFCLRFLRRPMTYVV